MSAWTSHGGRKVQRATCTSEEVLFTPPGLGLHTALGHPLLFTLHSALTEALPRPCCTQPGRSILSVHRATKLIYQHISGQEQQMGQSQSFPWPVWFHFLLVLLALGLTTDLFSLRHSTMAIGIAVDILGCTGTLEDRAATLNRIIQVAVELKDSMGDLYAFSAIMKALEMPQVNLHLLCAVVWACVYFMLSKWSAHLCLASHGLS